MLYQYACSRRSSYDGWKQSSGKGGTICHQTRQHVRRHSIRAIVVESDAESTEQLNRLQAVQFEGTTELHKRAAGAIDRIRSYTDEAGVEIEPVIKVGTPVDVIVGFAENNAVDTIIMTSQGRGGVKQTLLGSVTERAARRTTVPVLIIDSKGQSEGVSSEHDPDR